MRPSPTWEWRKPPETVAIKRIQGLLGGFRDAIWLISGLVADSVQGRNPKLLQSSGSRGF